MRRAPSSIRTRQIFALMQRKALAATENTVIPTAEAIDGRCLGQN